MVNLPILERRRESKWTRANHNKLSDQLKRNTLLKSKTGIIERDQEQEEEEIQARKKKEKKTISVDTETQEKVKHEFASQQAKRNFRKLKLKLLMVSAFNMPIGEEDDDSDESDEIGQHQMPYEKDDGGNDLHAAVFEGRYLDVKKLVSDDPSIVNEEDVFGNTALHIAAREGKPRIMRLLLRKTRKKMKVNHQNKDSRTPLHLAALIPKSFECIPDLCRYGAKPSFSDEDGRTPLHLAAQDGCLDAVTPLLKAGAALDDVDKEGLSPLHLAAREGEESVVHALMNQGANVDIVDFEGLTPLHHAVTWDLITSVRLLVDTFNADVNKKTHFGETALHLAAKKGAVRSLNYLVNKGADLECGNLAGNKPMHFAAYEGQVAAMECLLDQGANINSVNNSMDTPLHFASINGMDECVDLLLRVGANVQATNEDGESALHLASQTGAEVCIEMLLAMEANVNCVTMEAETPLHLASSYATVKLLVESGAHLNPKNRYKETPLLTTSAEGLSEAVAALLEEGADIDCYGEGKNTAMHLACYSGHADTLEVLLEAGVSTDQRNATESTPLHMAASKGRAECVAILLSVGANANCTNNTGNTPLMLAVRGQHVDVVQLLLRSGSKLDMTNKLGESVLHMLRDRIIAKICVKASKNLDLQSDAGDTPLTKAITEAHPDVVTVLIQGGANVNKCNNQQESPLFLSCLKTNSQMAVQLMQAGADCEVKGPDDMQPLHAAAMLGTVEVMTALIEAGASVKSVNSEGNTPAHLTDSPAALKILLTHGASVDARNKYQEVPLHTAAATRNKVGVDLLLGAGGEPNVQDDNGVTPLHIAAKLGQLEIVRALLDAGANPDVVEKRHKSAPVHLAVKYPLVTAALIDAKANLNAVDANGNTALHHVAFEAPQSNEVGALLVQNGADRGILNVERQTARDIALEIGNSEFADAVQSDSSKALELLAVLKDPKTKLREKAATCAKIGELGIGGASLTGELIDLEEKTTNDNYRSALIRSLGKVGEQSPKAIKHLTGLLQSENPSTRKAAFEALSSMGKAAHKIVPQLAEAMERFEEDQKIEDIHRWAFFGVDAADKIPTLLDYLNDDSIRLKKEVILALGAIGPGDPEAVAALTKELRNRNHQVRVRAYETLKRAGNEAKKAYPPLSQELKDYVHRVHVEELLDTVDRRLQASDEDKEAYSTTKLRTLIDALKELPNFGKQEFAVPLLKDLVSDPVKEVAERAVFAVGVAGEGDPEAVKFLVEMLDHEIVGVRRHAYKSLMTMGNSAATVYPGLEEKLAEFRESIDMEEQMAVIRHNRESSDSKQRNTEMITSLGEMKQFGQRAVRYLGELMPIALNDQENVAVRVAAIAAAGNIGREKQKVVNKLANLMMDEKQPSEIKTAAYNALRDMGTDGELQRPSLRSELEAIQSKMLLNGIIETLNDFDKAVEEMVALRRIENSLSSSSSDAIQNFEGETSVLSEGMGNQLDVLHDLSKFGKSGEPTIPVLISVIETSDKNDVVPEDVAAYSVRTLAMVGCHTQKGVDTLVSLLDANREPIRKAAYDNLNAKFESASAFQDDLRGILKSHLLHEKVRGLVVTANELHDGKKHGKDMAAHTKRRVEAITHIGELGTKAAIAIPNLKDLLKDEHARIRSAATRSLCRVGLKDKDTLDLVVSMLTNKDKAIRQTVFQELSANRDEVGKLLPDIDDLLRKCEIGDRLEQLLGVIQDKYRLGKHGSDRKAHTEKRLQALNEVAEFGEEAQGICEDLFALLSDEPDDIRIATINTLNAIGSGDTKVVEVLATMLEDVEHAIQEAAFNALHGMHTKGTSKMPGLKELLKEFEVRQRVEKLQGILQISKKMDVLGNESSSSDDGKEKTDAEKKQVEKERVEALEQLAKLTKEELSALGPSLQDVITNLLSCLRDSSSEIRLKTIYALAVFGLGNKVVVEAIGVLLNDPVPAVRNAAFMVLSGMYDLPKLVPQLVAELAIFQDRETLQGLLKDATDVYNEHKHGGNIMKHNTRRSKALREMLQLPTVSSEAIPRLLEALTRDDDEMRSDVLQTTVELVEMETNSKAGSIVGTGRANVVKSLHAVILNEDDEEMRSVAAECVTDILVGKQGDNESQKNKSRSIGQEERAETLSVFVKAMRRPNERIERAAARFGQDGLPVLMRYAESSDASANSRAGALQAIRRADCDRTHLIERIMPLADHENTGISVAAIQALAAIDVEDQRVLDLMCRVLKEGNPAQRTACAQALGQLQNNSDIAIPLLIQSLMDDQMVAFDALQQMGSAAVPHLMEVTTSNTAATDLRTRCVQILEMIGEDAEDAVEGLFDLVAPDNAAGMLVAPEGVPLELLNQIVRTLGVIGADYDDVVHLIWPTSIAQPSEQGEYPSGVHPSTIDVALQTIQQMEIAIPVLISELAETNDAKIVDALGMLGDNAVEDIIEALALTRDPVTMQLLLRALGAFGDQEDKVLPCVLSLLERNTVPLVGVEAVRTLARIVPCHPKLFELLQSSKPFLRRSAARSLAEFGQGCKDAIPCLLDALHLGEITFCEAIHSFGEPALGPLVKRATGKTVNPKLRKQNEVTDGQLWALKAVSYYKEMDDDHVNELIPLLSHNNKGVEIAAINTIPKVSGQNKQVVDVLIEKLNSSDRDAVKAAIAGLGEIGAPAMDAVEPLVAILEKESNRGAVKALASIGSHAARSLGQRVLDDSLTSETRKQCLEAISKMESAEASVIEKDMLQILENENGSPLMNEVLEACANVARTSKIVMDAMIEKFNEKNQKQNLRVAISRAWGHIGADADPAVPSLIEGLETNQPAFVNALARIGEVALDDILGTMRTSSNEVQRQCCRALGFLGPVAVEAIPDLEVMTRDDSMDVRFEALQALAGVAPGDIGVLNMLTEELENRDSRMRAAAGQSICRMEVDTAKKALSKLLRALRHPQDEIKEAVAYIGDEVMDELRHKLVSGTMDEANLVGLFGALELMNQRAEPALPELITVAQKHPSRGVRLAAMKTLGVIGTRNKDVLYLFTGLLESEDIGIREAAAEAMGNVQKVVGDLREEASKLRGNIQKAVRFNKVKQQGVGGVVEMAMAIKLNNRRTSTANGSPSSSSAMNALSIAGKRRSSANLLPQISSRGRSSSVDSSGSGDGFIKPNQSNSLLLKSLNASMASSSDSVASSDYDPLQYLEQTDADEIEDEQLKQEVMYLQEKIRGQEHEIRSMSEEAIGIDVSHLSDIQEAVVCGSIARVADLLSGGVPPDETGKEKKTALHLAAELHYPDIAELLLSYGAAYDKWVDGVQPLFRAHDMETAFQLVESGADVNAHSSSGGMTPVMSAVYNNASNVLEVLLTHGGDPNATDSQGRTAAHIAATLGREEMLDTLVQCGADLSIQDEDGNTPLHLAAHTHSVETCNTLMSLGSAVDILNNSKETAYLLNTDESHRTLSTHTSILIHLINVQIRGCSFWH
eukprot:TRINITY_DN1354_c2_g1_i6.p1 TRINITY_DN1354_c2_g1~~TRINITY_DN1354_c2_g1_i6.p1  ORF type:complete len:3511 (+),score=1204.02 TRINITY_DN1354_c2_g1_i6:206-10534(+)